MLRVYHLLLGAILLVLMPVGSKFVLPHFFSTKVAQSRPVATPTPTTPAITSNVIEGNIWQRVLAKNTPTPNGWQVAPCQGNALLLCVSSKREILGTVEIGVYPVKMNPDFQKNLVAAGIPLGDKADYQSPEYQTQVLKALKAWVAERYASLAKDHQSVYGDKISFSAYPPQQASLGKLQGIRYGFAGLKQEGGVQEQHIGHVAYDGTALYVITTAFDPSAVTGKFEKLENLAVFQPYLYAIAADLNLSMHGLDPKP
jgi:hypothetical protein